MSEVVAQTVGSSNHPTYPISITSIESNQEGPQIQNDVAMALQPKESFGGGRIGNEIIVEELHEVVDQNKLNIERENVANERTDLEQEEGMNERASYSIFPQEYANIDELKQLNHNLSQNRPQTQKEQNISQLKQQKGTFGTHSDSNLISQEKKQEIKFKQEKMKSLDLQNKLKYLKLAEDLIHERKETSAHRTPVTFGNQPNDTERGIKNKVGKKLEESAYQDSSFEQSHRLWSEDNQNESIPHGNNEEESHSFWETQNSPQLSQKIRPETDNFRHKDHFNPYSGINKNSCPDLSTRKSLQDLHSSKTSKSLAQSKQMMLRTNNPSSQKEREVDNEDTVVKEITEVHPEGTSRVGEEETVEIKNSAHNVVEERNGAIVHSDTGGTVLMLSPEVELNQSQVKNTIHNSQNLNQIEEDKEIQETQKPKQHSLNNIEIEDESTQKKYPQKKESSIHESNSHEDENENEKIIVLTSPEGTREVDELSHKRSTKSIRSEAINQDSDKIKKGGRFSLPTDQFEFPIPIEKIEDHKSNAPVESELEKEESIAEPNENLNDLTPSIHIEEAPENKTHADQTVGEEENNSDYEDDFENSQTENIYEKLNEEIKQEDETEDQNHENKKSSHSIQPVFQTDNQPSMFELSPKNENVKQNESNEDEITRKPSPNHLHNETAISFGKGYVHSLDRKIEDPNMSRMTEGLPEGKSDSKFMWDSQYSFSQNVPTHHLKITEEEEKKYDSEIEEKEFVGSARSEKDEENYDDDFEDEGKDHSYKDTLREKIEKQMSEQHTHHNSVSHSQQIYKIQDLEGILGAEVPMAETPILPELKEDSEEKALSHRDSPNTLKESSRNERRMNPSSSSLNEERGRSHKSTEKDVMRHSLDLDSNEEIEQAIKLQSIHSTQRLHSKNSAQNDSQSNIISERIHPVEDSEEEVKEIEEKQIDENKETEMKVEPKHVESAEQIGHKYDFDVEVLNPKNEKFETIPKAKGQSPIQTASPKFKDSKKRNWRTEPENLSEEKMAQLQKSKEKITSLYKKRKAKENEESKTEPNVSTQERNLNLLNEKNTITLSTLEDDSGDEETTKRKHTKRTSRINKSNPQIIPNQKEETKQIQEVQSMKEIKEPNNNPAEIVESKSNKDLSKRESISKVSKRSEKSRKSKRSKSSVRETQVKLKKDFNEEPTQNKESNPILPSISGRKKEFSIDDNKSSRSDFKNKKNTLQNDRPSQKSIEIDPSQQQPTPYSHESQKSIGRDTFYKSNIINSLKSANSPTTNSPAKEYSFEMSPIRKETSVHRRQQMLNKYGNASGGSNNNKLGDESDGLSSEEKSISSGLIKLIPHKVKIIRRDRSADKIEPKPNKYNIKRVSDEYAIPPVKTPEELPPKNEDELPPIEPETNKYRSLENVEKPPPVEDKVAELERDTSEEIRESRPIVDEGNLADKETDSALLKSEDNTFYLLEREPKKKKKKGKSPYRGKRKNLKNKIEDYEDTPPKGLMKKQSTEKDLLEKRKKHPDEKKTRPKTDWTNQPSMKYNCRACMMKKLEQENSKILGGRKSPMNQNFLNKSFKKKIKPLPPFNKPALNNSIIGAQSDGIAAGALRRKKYSVSTRPHREFVTHDPSRKFKVSKVGRKKRSPIRNQQTVEKKEEGLGPQIKESDLNAFDILNKVLEKDIFASGDKEQDTVFSRGIKLQKSLIDSKKAMRFITQHNLYSSNQPSAPNTIEYPSMHNAGSNENSNAQLPLSDAGNEKFKPVNIRDLENKVTNSFSNRKPMNKDDPEWNAILDHLKQNPQLLMNMIPSPNYYTDASRKSKIKERLKGHITAGRRTQADTISATSNKNSEINKAYKKEYEMNREIMDRLGKMGMINRHPFHNSTSPRNTYDLRNNNIMNESTTETRMSGNDYINKLKKMYVGGMKGPLNSIDRVPKSERDNIFMNQPSSYFNSPERNKVEDNNSQILMELVDLSHSNILKQKNKSFDHSDVKVNQFPFSPEFNPDLRKGPKMPFSTTHNVASVLHPHHQHSSIRPYKSHASSTKQAKLNRLHYDTTHGTNDDVTPTNKNFLNYSSNIMQSQSKNTSPMNADRKEDPNQRRHRSKKKRKNRIKNLHSSIHNISHNNNVFQNKKDSIDLCEEDERYKNESQPINPYKILQQDQKLVPQRTASTDRSSIGDISNAININLHNPNNPMLQEYTMDSAPIGTPIGEEPATRDWGNSLLLYNTKNGVFNFNQEKDVDLYHEFEIDYIMNMFSYRHKDLKSSDLIKPFFFKTKNTIKKLSVELLIPSQYEFINRIYRKATIQNTMKLLYKCKILFEARKRLIPIFSYIGERELLVNRDITFLVNQDPGTLDTNQKQYLITKVKALKNITEQLKSKINKLRKQFAFLSGPFILNNFDYLEVIQIEWEEISSIMRHVHQIELDNE